MRERHSVPRMCEREAAVLIWDELRPKDMHLPMRCLVSESQRGDIAPGEVSALEDRWEVDETVRLEEVVGMFRSRRNALRGMEVDVFMARAKPFRRY